jgi:hypothetical protein
LICRCYDSNVERVDWMATCVIQTLWPYNESILITGFFASPWIRKLHCSKIIWPSKYTVYSLSTKNWQRCKTTAVGCYCLLPNSLKVNLFALVYFAGVSWTNKLWWRQIFRSTFYDLFPGLTRLIKPVSHWENPGKSTRCK